MNPEQGSRGRRPAAPLVSVPRGFSVQTCCTFSAHACDTCTLLSDLDSLPSWLAEVDGCGWFPRQRFQTADHGVLNLVDLDQPLHGAVRDLMARCMLRPSKRKL